MLIISILHLLCKIKYLWLIESVYGLVVIILPLFELFFWLLLYCSGGVICRASGSGAGFVSKTPGLKPGALFYLELLYFSLNIFGVDVSNSPSPKFNRSSLNSENNSLALLFIKS